MLGTSEEGSNSQSKVGYKGVTTKDIKRRTRWNAHVHGVAEIKALQSQSNTAPTELLEKAPIRRKMSSLNKFSFLSNKPYAVITLSEFGIPKKWSWIGIPLDDDANIDPTGSLTADFQNLFSALNSNVSTDESSSLDCVQIPTGASQERVAGILKWVLPPLTEFYNTRVGLLKPALSEMQKNPLLSRNRGSSGRPSTIEPSPNSRRASVSELLWTNNFLGSQQSTVSENDLDSVSSAQTFISNGLEKSQVLQELTSEDLQDENLDKIRQNARSAGICLVINSTESH